jgi:hypothetical protein
MEKTKTVRKIMDWNPIVKRPKARPKTIWREEVLNDLNNSTVKNWTYFVKTEQPGRN